MARSFKYSRLRHNKKHPECGVLNCLRSKLFKMKELKVTFSRIITVLKYQTTAGFWCRRNDGL